MNLKDYLRKQCDEIFDDRILRVFGAILCVIQILTAYFWFHAPLNVLDEFIPRYPWPGVPDILLIRSSEFWFGIIFFWTAISGIAMVQFIRSNRSAYILLLIAFSLKLMTFFQDYRLMGNYHYTANIFTFLFLFVGNKRTLLCTFVVLVYMASGLIKLNREWLTGQAVGQMPQFLNVFGWGNFVGVVVLELVLAPVLLARGAVWRWTTWVLFFLFHLMSIFWIKLFYPILSVLLLLIFPLGWRLDDRDVINDLRKNGQVAWAAIALFIIGQLIPKIQSADPALSGANRIWSVNMFDARPICIETAFLRYEGKTIELSQNVPYSDTRLRCDPLMYLERMKTACNSAKEEADFIDGDFVLMSRRHSDSVFRPIVRIEDFCSKEININLFGFNEWVRYE